MKFSLPAGYASKSRYLLTLVLLVLIGMGTFVYNFTDAEEENHGAGDVRVFIPGGFAWQHNFKAAIFGNGELFPLLKVAVPPKARMTSLLSPYGDGFDRELLTQFSQDYGFSLQFIEVVSLEQAGRLLTEGAVDLAAGFAASAETLDLAKQADMALSPAYQKVSPMLLSVGKTRKSESDVIVLDPELNRVAGNAALSLEKEPLSDDVSDLIAYLEAGRTGYALIDNAYLNMLRPLFSDVKTSALPLDGSIYHHWIWRNDDSLHALSLAAFWKDRQTGKFLEDLHERYQAFLPVRQSRNKTMALIKGLEHELEQYHEAINDASRKYNIDPLLLTAIMYQESKFQHTMGQNGQGLMQLTRSTAALLGVDAQEPTSNIMGGAKYLRSIFDSLPDDMPYWDRWFLTLAGYNQGPGIMNSAVKIARRDNENMSWRAIKEAYLYLEKHPGEGGRSRVRGRHVINYVQSIRYYYYVLNGLVILDRPEAQHLTPLLAGAGVVHPTDM